MTVARPKLGLKFMRRRPIMSMKNITSLTINLVCTSADVELRLSSGLKRLTRKASSSATTAPSVWHWPRNGGKSAYSSQPPFVYCTLSLDDDLIYRPTQVVSYCHQTNHPLLVIVRAHRLRFNAFVEHYVDWQLGLRIYM